MNRTAILAAIILLASLVGCGTFDLFKDETTALVPESPFAQTASVPVQTRAAFPQASTEMAVRVDSLGRKIVAANPQMGMRPQFRTIGAPKPEIFHVGTTEVDLTVGLVEMCKTDAELAAVLCHELGKMVSEREALAGRKTRTPEHEPPLDVRVGNDSAGSFGPPDQTHLAELAKFDKTRPQVVSAPMAPPDPDGLARGFLTKAGFADKDLNSVVSQLKAAEANSSFEKQFAPGTPVRPFVP